LIKRIPPLEISLKRRWKPWKSCPIAKKIAKGISGSFKSLRKCSGFNLKATADFLVLKKLVFEIELLNL
jgi:hypothetical protein